MIRTTICCSLALALIGADGKPSPRPLLYFPLSNVWSAELPAAPVGAAAYDETTAYVAMTNGRLVAMGLADAKPRWTVETLAAGDLAVGQGLVFVPGFGAIEARAASDGAVKWRLPIGTKVSSPLVWDAGWIVVGTERGDVLALRAEDGAIVWRVSLGAAMRSRPALAADHVYVPLEDGHVIAYALETGKEVWTQKLGGAASDVLALDDRVFVGSRDNFFYCLEPATGKRKWAPWRTGADVIGAPAVDRDHVYFVSLDNVLRAVDRDNGALQWQQPLPLRPPAGPLLVDDLVLISGVSVNIRGFLAKNGRPMGDYGAPADLMAPPVYLQRVPGASAAPLLMLLMIDQTTPRLEAMTSELPIL